MNVEIIDVIWFTSGAGLGYCGIVLVKTKATGELKGYISPIDGRDEEFDKSRIAEWGAKFPLEATKALFPQYF